VVTARHRSHDVVRGRHVAGTVGLVLAAGALVVGGLQLYGTRPSAEAPSDATAARAVPWSPVLLGREPVGRPDVLLITTDDQNRSDLRWMPRTRRLLGAAGMTFPQALSPHPLCCPARAEILTGQYAQNNGVQHNHGAYGGYRRLNTSQTLGPWLQSAGYRTAFLGKFLNEYGRSSPRPPGWTIWDPMVAGLYSYFGTTFDRGGATGPTRYSVDVVADRTVRYVRELARGDRPFFLWASQVAPHSTQLSKGVWGPPRVPARFAHVLGGARLPGRPATRPTGVLDPTCVCDQTLPTRRQVRRDFLQRIRTLQAVDEGVARAVRALARARVLDRTYVVFGTDNAMLLGEHGYVGKNLLYEEDLRIPLLVRGPGVGAGTRSDLAVTLPDLATTVLAVAHAHAGVPQDGVSFLRALHGHHVRWRDTQLIQTGTTRPNPDLLGWAWRGVRTVRYTYAVDVAAGRQVLFDRLRDPRELVDLSATPAYGAVRRELARRAARLASCAGAACSIRFGPPPGLLR
jgi:arylsulfatase A-like enzyme